ncbi:MAG: Xaa-Pro dipeptidase [Chloroflexota bacterium]|jgi:Xaa-Pro aminopeptidase|nr:Xaa-Pro dipeptidase [Chloroflexota bacterium]
MMPPSELPVPRFSLAERDRRWAAVRANMARDGVDALITVYHTGHHNHWQADCQYLSQIGGNNVDASLVFPLEGEPTGFVINEFYEGPAARDWMSDFRPTRRAWGDMISERIKELGLEGGRLAISGLRDHLRAPEGIVPSGTLDRIRELLPEAEIVNGTWLCQEPRMRKSAEEVAFLDKSLELIERSVDAMYRTARPGVQENVVYAAMIYEQIAGGGDMPTMLSWLSGPWGHVSQRVLQATQRVLQKNDMIINEIESRYGGYCAQQVQPMCVGKAPDDVHEMFKWQHEAFEAVRAIMKPGTTFDELLEAGKMVGKKSDQYTSSLTLHGRGLGEDWPLLMGRYSPEIGRMQLEERMTFIMKPTVRPKNAEFRGEGIVWGDTIEVTASGGRRMGKRPYGLLELDL